MHFFFDVKAIERTICAGNVSLAIYHRAAFYGRRSFEVAPATAPVRVECKTARQHNLLSSTSFGAHTERYKICPIPGSMNKNNKKKNGKEPNQQRTCRMKRSKRSVGKKGKTNASLARLLLGGNRWYCQLMPDAWWPLCSCSSHHTAPVSAPVSCKNESSRTICTHPFHRTLTLHQQAWGWHSKIACQYCQSHEQNAGGRAGRCAMRLILAPVHEHQHSAPCRHAGNKKENRKNKIKNRKAA